jgi:hypothetical protein
MVRLFPGKPASFFTRILCKLDPQSITAEAFQPIGLFQSVLRRILPVTVELPSENDAGLQSHV